MRNKKTISEQEFFSLSMTQQAKELKKLTKRANVRLSLLEEKDSINLAYRQAYQYNISENRENNRFYEGVVYKTTEAIKKAYNSVSSFLENKASTLKGVESNVKDVIQGMGENIDKSTIDKMNSQERRYASKYIAQESNKKLAELEKNNITQYAYGLAEKYNISDEKRDKNRYYRGMKFKDDEKLDIHLDEMIYFYNAKTSSVEGYNKSVSARLDAFRAKGINIPTEREEEFFQFLASEEFKQLGSKASSNQVVETFNEAMDIEKTVEEINKNFKLFLDGYIKFDKVIENLGVAKWSVETKQEKFKFQGRKK